MAEISALLVKELRDKTGAGMADCKKALTESDGDMKVAIEILRKKGAASAAKRADRSAKEGIIVSKTSADGKKAAIVEINCETDFVARNAEFVNFADASVEAILNNKVSTLEELSGLKVGEDTLGGKFNEILAKFSENISIRRFERFESNGFIGDYIHAGSKLAVLVEVNAADLNDKAKLLLRDIAMQIAAMKPDFIDRSVVPQEVLAKEIEIYKQQAIDQGKKEDIADRIAQGRLDKFYQEQCLVEQVFVKDSAKTIADVIKEISKEAGAEVKVTMFRRYFLGEEE
jgi:elongation factor Ts